MHNPQNMPQGEDKKIRIIITSQDTHFMSALQHLLPQDTYHTETTDNIEVAIAKVIHLPYHLIILDSSDTQDNKEYVQRIRENKKNIPIMVVSDDLKVENKLSLLNRGVDIIIDRNTANECIERQINSFMKRCFPEKQPIILTESLQLNSSTLEATYNRRKTTLRQKEFLLLAYLASHPNKVFSREYLYKTIWGEKEAKSNTIDTHITQIRKKIGDKTKNFIRTIHSKGYALMNH